MPFNTFSVATAVTPSVVETYISHYLNRGPLRQKPTAHISYHEGLRLIRRFLEYASLHSIEDLQAFTAQWVPVPVWCRVQSCEVPPQFLERSAKVIREQLGSLGTRLVGGEKWWQWRRPETPLHAEWIEMKKDFNERRRAGVKCDRVILYVHGGAYYFGSVDEHRYQMQRHARKLKARVLAPRYRLAPQFPFPCGLHDCIATYFYLLEHFPPEQILFAGDSAGGGMVISMLVTLRDQGLPLPAGAILLSPWVDLTHSFPSVAGDGASDYIPAAGFHHRPSLAWPPPPTETVERKFTQPIEQAFDVVELPATDNLDLRSPIHGSIDSEQASTMSRRKNTPAPMNRNGTPGLGDKLEIEIDGAKIVLKEQIQMYAKNELLTHPLVSPVQQPSLGGLPPLLIQVGGGELLRDEQIYLAHKAADPKNYPPCDAILDDFDPRRAVLNRYPPTDVQLQVWEDLCHVPHTLSFTRPAKYMYRSVAQFGAWALAHAQHKSIEIQDEDAVSIISQESANEKDGGRTDTFGSIGDDGVTSTQLKLASIGAVGRAGDELPPFEDHMIRQRVNRHGLIFPLPHKSTIASLHLDPATIGAVKPGPVRKWLAKRKEHDRRFEKEYKKVAKKRAKEAALGYDPIEEGENPPPTALYLRRRRGAGPEEKKRSKSWGLAMWSGWGSSHDETVLQNEKKIEEEKAAVDPTRLDTAAGGGKGGMSRTNLAVPGQDVDGESTKKARRISGVSFRSQMSNKTGTGAAETRPRSSSRKVTDEGQADIQAIRTDAAAAASPAARSDAIPAAAVAEGVAAAGSAAPVTSASWATTSNTTTASDSTKPKRNRPMSMAAPIPVSTLSSVAPNMSDTNKEAVKIPGSDNTYLNPSSSRPHNGFVAYPFKLRQQDTNDSPNPSTMTLDSEHYSELPGDEAPAAVELPTGMEVSQGSPLQPQQGQNGDAFTAAANTASAVSAPAHESSSTPFVPVAPVISSTHSQPDTPLVSAVSERPGVEFPEYGNAAGIRSADEDPISPLGDETSAAAMAASSSMLKPKQSTSKFESRDSRLGNLGADGMPIAAFPALAAAQHSARGGKNGDASAQAASPTSPTPFKLRNPVYDPRVDSAPAPASSATSSADPAVIAAQAAAAHATSPNPSSTAAAFKLRNGTPTTTTAIGASNTIDTHLPTLPNGVSFPAPPSAPQSPSKTKSSSSSSSKLISSRSGNTAIPDPIDIKPAGQYTRPVTRDSDVPPTPPPKDDVPVAVAGIASRSRPGTSAGGNGVAPSIGALSFENVNSMPSRAGNGNGNIGTASRPQLETFVTAKEDLQMARK